MPNAAPEIDQNVKQDTQNNIGDLVIFQRSFTGKQGYHEARTVAAQSKDKHKARQHLQSLIQGVTESDGKEVYHLGCAE